MDDRDHPQQVRAWNLTRWQLPRRFAGLAAGWTLLIAFVARRFRRRT